MGGVSYTELLIKALRSLPAEQQPKITLILNENLIADPESIALFTPVMDQIDELALVYPAPLSIEGHQSKPTKVYQSYAELNGSVDFVYPAHARVIDGIPSASWWPDFQHKHLPHFFKADDINGREQALRNIYNNANCTVFSSKNALEDFNKFYPGYRGHTAVLPFFANPEMYSNKNPAETVRKYNLPENYFLCCNQFWIHKNHSLIFKALAELKNQNKCPHVVFTGQTMDDRFPEYFEQLMALRKQLKLEDHTQILGVIPREDQLQLIRGSAAMIQPSLFEGWSTVVEDARAYGKPIFLSDIPVHFEQAPRYGVYFSRNDHVALSRLIESFDCKFAAKQRESREEIALKESSLLARTLGESLVNMAQQLRQKTQPAMAVNQSMPFLGLA